MRLLSDAEGFKNPRKSLMINRLAESKTSLEKSIKSYKSRWKNDTNYCESR